MRPTPTGLHHVALRVVDLPAAEAFYSGVLGLAIDRRWPDADGGTRSVWLRLAPHGRLMLETGAPKSTPDAETGGGWHLVALGIRRSERGRWVEHLQRAGVAVEATTPYTLYVRDPEGNRVGLSHWPDPADTL